MSFKPFHTVHLDTIELVADDELPPNVSGAASMMSPPERALLYTLAKDHYRGEGLIIDAGVFLGASTIGFGQGLKDSGKTIDGKPIIVLDQAIVTPGMMGFFKRKGLCGHLALDDDLRPEIRKNTAEMAELADYRFGDILEETLEEAQRIEICFLDLLKTYAINQYVTESFYPHFIPGKTILIQQDYFYHRLPYIKVYQEYFADYFDYLGMVRNSAVFRHREEIPAEMLGRDLFAELPGEELLALHAKAEARSEADAGRHLLCALSRVELIAEIGGKEAGREALAQVRNEFRPILANDDFALGRRVVKEFEGLMA